MFRLLASTLSMRIILFRHSSKNMRMANSAYGRIVRESGRSQTMEKLDSMARQLTGYGLSVIIPPEN
jgi:hypothetical protein